MSLVEGQRLGPYAVLGRIGAGGMGEVYRARDTRLDRTVALKILPAEVSGDAALRSRFEREAKAISALAHPHICSLFDIGEQDGQTFLVMEYLEGQTLLERLRKGPMPLAPAVKVATQVAEALSAAHRQGIIHRDLKPGNVVLTKTGAKLLDFGLARLTAHGGRPAVESLTDTPTESAPLTGRGTLLGTLPYMAPEQLEGRPADARTDLWALGLLIYEMLTGHRAFEGQSQVSLIGAILEREPESLGRLQPLTPASLERLVKRCLAKSPDDRWDTAHDLADELRWIADVGPAAAASTKQRPVWIRMLGIAVAAVAGLLLGLLAGGWLRPNLTPERPVVRTLIDVDPLELAGGSTDGATPGGSRTALDWTPDGHALAFVARPRGGIRLLYVRDLARDEARSLAGTEGAQVPAVSTDGRWIAFWAMGQIKRISVLGGPTSVLVPEVVYPPRGMVWGPSGRLYYGGTDSRIWRVAAETTPQPVTALQQTEVMHELPHLLPGEKAVLFTLRQRYSTWGDEEVVAQDLATGERKVLLRDAVDARYLPSGHLVYMRQGVLMAAVFDLDGLTVRGEPVPVLEGVGQALAESNSDNQTGAGQFAVSPSGTLAYVAGRRLPLSKLALVGIDRGGRVSPLAAPTRSYNFSGLSLAPDGRRLAVTTVDIREHVNWIVDISRGTLARLPGGGEFDWLRWTPDGQRVAFTRLANGVNELVWQRADGTADPEPLVRGEHQPSSWSPDGKYLATVLDDDIWIVTVAGATPIVGRLSETPESEAWPEFSPDGRWLAYGSNTTGRNEIYIQPWPGRGPREQVSLEGGESPAWNPSGRELFFLSRFQTEGTGQLWTVDVETGPRLRIGTPRPLFDFPFPSNELFLRCYPLRCYAVSPDGGRFYATQEQPLPPTPPVTHVRLIQGWLEAMKARVSGDVAQ